jgi:1-acyl-sn-glycerol-3-phosphate acyltransferase
MKPIDPLRAWAAFELVFRPWMRRRLRGPYVLGEAEAVGIPAGPLLLMANHVSWWDGFLLREVHRLLRPDRPLHVVMAGPELARHGYFRHLGAVPLAPGRLGARGLLRTLEGLREREPDLVVGYFPQGRIWPSWRRPLGFRGGGAWLADRLGPATVLPVGLHVEPLNRSAPSAFIALGPPLPVPLAGGAEALEAEVGRAVDRIMEVLGRHGEAAPGLWGEK